MVKPIENNNNQRLLAGTPAPSKRKSSSGEFVANVEEKNTIKLEYLKFDKLLKIYFNI